MITEQQLIELSGCIRGHHCGRAPFEGAPAPLLPAIDAFKPAEKLCGGCRSKIMKVLGKEPTSDTGEG